MSPFSQIKARKPVPLLRFPDEVVLDLYRRINVTSSDMNSALIFESIYAQMKDMDEEWGYNNNPRSVKQLFKKLSPNLKSSLLDRLAEECGRYKRDNPGLVFKSVCEHVFKKLNKRFPCIGTCNKLYTWMVSMKTTKFDLIGKLSVLHRMDGFEVSENMQEFIGREFRGGKWV